MNLFDAIEALEEVKVVDDSIYAWNPGYIRALDMVIKAAQKQIPKAPVEVNVQPYFRKHFAKQYACPVCNRNIQGNFQYCPHCGQAIKWR